MFWRFRGGNKQEEYKRGKPGRPLITKSAVVQQNAPFRQEIGNMATGRLLRSKIHNSEQGDSAEQEAERLSEEVQHTELYGKPTMLKPSRTVSEKPGTDPLLGSLETGQPLAPATRSFFEARLGHDLAHVRLNSGSRAADRARSLGARAFTVGHHVVLGKGERTSAPDRLLAHELVHVIQQEVHSQATTQRFPAPLQPLNWSQLVSDLAVFVQTTNNPADPVAIQAALAHLSTFGVNLAQIIFSRLTNVSWIMGGGLHRHAESRWPSGGSPEIAVSDGLLRELHDYQTDRAGNIGDGFSVLRTISHELRHLQRDQQRTAGARTATIAETRFETEVAARAAQTPAGLTPQEYAQVYTGRMLYAQTAYPVEEILARLSEVAIARLEWNRLRGSANIGRDHIEMILQEIGFRIYYQINILRGSSQLGIAGLTSADFIASMSEIETEIASLYGVQSPERRLWDLARSGIFATPYHQNNVVVPRIFP